MHAEHGSAVSADRADRSLAIRFQSCLCSEPDAVQASGDHDEVPTSIDPAARQTKVRAIERIAAIGEMTAGLAHDFRNILAIIESGLRLAERNADDPKKVEAALAAAHEGISRGIRLTSRLVLFARPEKADVRSEDINALLKRMKRFLEYGAGPGIRVRLDLAPSLPRCRIDPQQFNSAILNLVINARDAMPDGGEIRIETDMGRQLTEPSGAPASHGVRIRISDRGCGMPPEIARHLFDPYFTTKGEAGTGLGLPQVAAFMRSSGGTVCVSTEAGVGTSFELLFPPADCSEAIAGNLWRQLDRWVNEGGRPGPAQRLSGQRCRIEGPPDRPRPAVPVIAGPKDADLSGTHAAARDQ